MTYHTDDSKERTDSNRGWTLLDIDELVDEYWETVAPALEADGLDPSTDRPSHQWLSKNGFRGLVYALRTYHNRSFGEFWAHDLDLEQPQSYDWELDDDQTVELLEAFLDSRRSRGDLSESSIETLRYRLGRYVRAYAAENGSDDLLTPIAPESEVPIHRATDAAWAAFDRVDDQLQPTTMRRIHEAVDSWYTHLVRRKRAAANPVAGLEDEYGWNRGAGTESISNPSLESDHVKSLYRAATTPEEALLVVALCGWGLRSSEVAALHRSQLVLDAEDIPYVRFSERKNGPGEVSILFGEAVAQDRVIELSEQEAWTGYLFPSTRSNSGHITRQTVLNRFDSLVERADIPQEIKGQKPVPQMARRFWYDAYAATQDRLFDEIEEIAEEQGSASPTVVMQNYLSSARRRALRRDAMRSELSAAFDV